VQELASVLQSMIDIRDKVQEENQQLVARCEMHNPKDISMPSWKNAKRFIFFVFFSSSNAHFAGFWLSKRPLRWQAMLVSIIKWVLSPDSVATLRQNCLLLG
jgi:hypothetical protein